MREPPLAMRGPRGGTFAPFARCCITFAAQHRGRVYGRDQAMKQSTDRILTTHVGSLIRPAPLQEFLRAKQAGRSHEKSHDKSYDQAAYEACLKSSVADVVRKQAEVGVDVVSDGEFGKSISWSQYVLERLSGFESRPSASGRDPYAYGADRTRFKEFYAELDSHDGGARGGDAVCVAPITYTRQA